MLVTDPNALDAVLTAPVIEFNAPPAVLTTPAAVDANDDTEPIAPVTLLATPATPATPANALPASNNEPVV